MNTQCPRCLSSTFRPTVARVLSIAHARGYRVEGKDPGPVSFAVVGCAFCDGATVTKTGGGFTTQVRVERQAEAPVAG